MRLGSVIDIVGGELINSSSISHFNELKFYPKSVKKGDLFIAFEKEAIDEAIENGAYGILFEDKLEFDSNLDVAFIRVNSILNAVLKLLRLMLLNKSFKFFYIDEVSCELAQKLIIHKQILFLSSSNLDNFHKITTSENGTIFLSSNSEFLDTVWPLYERVEKSSKNLIVAKEFLFETSFTFEDEFFYKSKIPPIFLDNLSKVLEFFKNHKIEFSLKSLNFIKHFEPLFVDKNLHIKEFAKSSRVLIFEPNLKLFQKEIEYLNQNIKWAKTILLLPNSKNKKENNLKNVKFFKSNDELIEILKSNDFNFSLIGGREADEIKSLLDIKLEEKSLF